MDHEETLLDKYIYNVKLLSYQVSWLATLSDLVEDGSTDVLEDIKTLIKRVQETKGVLLNQKERLGFTDGLSFLENNRFDGFEVKNGRFIDFDKETDLTKLETIVEPWINQGPEINNYCFEVGIYLTYMAIHKNMPLHPEPDKPVVAKRIGLLTKLKEVMTWLKNKLSLIRQTN